MVCRMKADLASIRSDYQRAGLDEQSAPSDPIRLFERWMQDAIDAKHPEPNAATLATLGEDGDPDARVVLLKGVDDAGFVFYTSYESAKARQLAAHPRATLVFFWLMLERQVRVRGEVSGWRGPHSSGHAYFALKDERSRLEAVIWKGTFGRLKFLPEEGLEVIASGRLTTYPGSSKYQIVIDSIEPAGAGALMALLEERRRRHP